jgi:hypothetical protein
MGLTTTFDNPQTIELPAEPHPLVAAWMEEERQSEKATLNEGRTIRPKREDSYMGRRKLRISSALFKTAEAKGYGLEYPDGRVAPVSLSVRGQSIKWSLEEQTGLLTFKLFATCGRHMKTRMSERMDKPFERRIEEVLRRFEKLADATIAYDRRSAEIERETEEEISAIERPRRLKVMEKARWERLRQQAEDWHEAESLHAFIDAIEQALGKKPRSGREIAWLDWARKRAERLDPLSRRAVSARGITRWRYDPHPSEYELSVWELGKLG